MQLETILSVPMSNLIFETHWQIDDHNSLEGALFNAHTASNAHIFCDQTDFGGLSDLNTYLTCFVNRTSLLALLSALLWLAFIRIDNGNSILISFHLIVFMSNLLVKYNY